MNAWSELKTFKMSKSVPKEKSQAVNMLSINWNLIYFESQWTISISEGIQPKTCSPPCPTFHQWTKGTQTKDDADAD